MKVVIDTNGLLRSIPQDGSYRWLYDAFAANQFTWVVSTEILLEYAEMTGYYYSPVAAELVTSLLLAAPNHVRQEPYFRFGQVNAIRTTTNLWTVPLPPVSIGWYRTITTF